MSPRSRTLLLALLACACADEPASTGSTGAATDGPVTSSTGDAPTSTTTTSGPDVTGDPTTAPPTTGDAPVDCNGIPVCKGDNSCSACALANDCSAEKASCDATPNDECNLHLWCLDDCRGGEACNKVCSITYPGGYAPAWALTDCTQCDACMTSCAPMSGAYCAGGGGGPGQVTTCDEVGDCETCTHCSLGQACAAVHQACQDEPECGMYWDCHGNCGPDDAPCLDVCQDMYPSGYMAARAEYECLYCDECRTSCSELPTDCRAGGPDGECAVNADCVRLYDSQPFCVEHECVQCLTDDNCLERGAAVCSDGFCV